MKDELSRLINRYDELEKDMVKNTVKLNFLEEKTRHFLDDRFTAITEKARKEEEKAAGG